MLTIVLPHRFIDYHLFRLMDCIAFIVLPLTGLEIARLSCFVGKYYMYEELSVGVWCRGGNFR